MDITTPTIRANSVEIVVTLTATAPLKIKYGTAVNNLNESLVLADPNTKHTFILTRLSPNQRYYFQLQTGDGTNKNLSDIFTFTTAQSSNSGLALNITSLVVSQKGGVLYSSSFLKNELKRTVVVVNNSVVDLYISIEDTENFQEVDALIQLNKILGASTEFETEQLQSNLSRLTKVNSGLYVGKLQVPRDAGEYQFVIRVKDTLGNYTEEGVVTVKVISKLIIKSTSGTAIENAKIMFSVYNLNTKLYEEISNITTSFINPAFSEFDGTVSTNLFPGKYKAEVSAIGYKNQEVFFDLGSDSELNLPTVVLEESTIPLISLTISGLQIATNFTNTFVTQLQMLAKSSAFFQTMLLGSCIVFIVISIVTVFLKKHPKYDLDNLILYHRQLMTTRILSLVLFVILKCALFCTEFFLIIASIFSLLFIASFGLQKALPFLAVVAVSIKKFRWQSS